MTKEEAAEALRLYNADPAAFTDKMKAICKEVAERGGKSPESACNTPPGS